MITFPKAWQTTTIGKAFSIKQGKSLSRRKQTGKNQRPFLRTANVFWGNLKLDVLDEMSFTDDECVALALESGDLLVCEGGDIGRTAIWRGEMPDCLYQNHLHRLRRVNDDVLPLFVMYWLQAGMTQLNVYEGAGNKTTIPNLSRSRLADFEIPLPPLPEQKKIAAVLLKVQRAIETQDRIIQSLRDLKKSTTQHLITHGLRGEKTKMTEIGEIPESWDVVPLEKVREFLQYGTSKRCTLKPKGIAVLRIPNVIGGQIDVTELKYADVPAAERERFGLMSGDVLFVRTNGQKHFVGRTAVYRDAPAPAMFASYLIRARLIRHELRPDFLQLYTETEQGRGQLSGRAAPASDGKFNINTKTINSMLVAQPEPGEQEDIAANISTISAKIGTHESKKAALQGLFKTTLNKLMTGDIRVADLDIDVKEVEV